MTNSIVKEIIDHGNNIIEDNNFLFVAFENRLIVRITHIFEKYKIPINNNMLKKNIEENLINNLRETNKEIIDRYVKLLENFEKIINEYVVNKTKTEIIKKSTMAFVDKISSKNKTFITTSCVNNFLEYVKSIIYVYDNQDLNNEVINRITTDTKEILNEFNRNNYNFVISSINDIIKNIIKNM